MKKIAIYISLFLGVILMSNSLNAQITLVKDTVFEENNQSTTYFQTAIVVTKENYLPEKSYYIEGLSSGDNTNCYEIRLFNSACEEVSSENYNIFNSLNSLLLNSWEINKVVPTRKIFDNDDQFEFLISLKKQFDNYYKYRLILVDENGIRIEGISDDIEEELCRWSSDDVNFWITIVDGKYGLVYKRTVKRNYNNQVKYDYKYRIYKIEGVVPDLESIEVEYSKM